MKRLRVSGELRVPGDKSISHRALILGALAEGRSVARGILASADVRSTAEALRALGASVVWNGDAAVVQGRGAHALREASAPLDCGNSGTTTRLLAGVAAAAPFVTRFTGDASLSRRPMRRIARPLEAMGARVELTDGHLPMTVTGGALQPLRWESEVASAQVKSAILLAALVAHVPVEVHEPQRSRDHTERMLRARGVAVLSNDTTVTLQSAARIEPVDALVPGDPSSAAFLVALATLAGAGELRLSTVGVNPTRTGFLAAIAEMGGDVTLEDITDAGGEPVASIRVRPSGLRSLDVKPEAVPAMIDELPLLACVAARAEGTTVIRGAAELRVKESDRITAVVAGLRSIGADAEELPDGLAVTGSDRPLVGLVRTHGDHRIAMAFGVLGALPGNAIEVDDPACVSISYPEFWRDLRRAVDA